MFRRRLLVSLLPPLPDNQSTNNLKVCGRRKGGMEEEREEGGREGKEGKERGEGRKEGEREYELS